MFSDKDFEYVRTLEKYKNFSKAAEALYIAQPSLSRYIKTLEQKLGVTIFDRGKMPIEITAAGKCFLSYGNKLKDVEEEMMAQINKLKNTSYEKVRFGVPNVIGDYILPRILPKFLRDNPAANIKNSMCGTPELIEMLRSKRLDLIICAETFQHKGIAIEYITKDPIVLIAKKDHPILKNYDTSKCDIENPLDIELRQLKNERFIKYDPNFILSKLVDDLLIREGVQTENVIMLPSVQSSIRMVFQGMGLAFAMKSILKYGSYKDSDIMCPIRVNADMKLYAAYNKMAYEKNESLRNLVKYIKDEYMNEDL